MFNAKLLSSGGNSSVLQSLLIGHCDSGSCKNSGPFCQSLFFKFIQMFPCWPPVSSIHLLYTYFQLFGFLEVWISPIQFAAYVLNPYDSLQHSCDHFRVNNKDLFLVSSLIKLQRRFDMTAALISSLTNDIFFIGATLFLAAIILLSNFSFGNSHLAYAHVSYLDASLEMDHFLLPMEEYIAWKITASFIEKMVSILFSLKMTCHHPIVKCYSWTLDNYLKNTFALSITNSVDSR